VELWEALTDQLDNASTKLGHTQVLRKFTTSRPSPDKIVTQYVTKLIAFRRKLIGTTENITDDTMKTHIFTPLLTSYETTIQILAQRIPAPSAKHCMKAIHEYAEGITLTKAIADASTEAAQYSYGRNHGHGHGGRGGGGGGGPGNGRQKHKCTYCKMDNHTTEACGKRKHAESNTNASSNDKRTCYHCCLTGHLKADFIHFKCSWNQHIKVNKGTSSASLATAGDLDLI